MPPFVHGLFNIRGQRALQRRVPTVVLLAQLEKSTMEIVEDTARHHPLLGHRLPSVLHHDHLIGIALGLPLGVTGIRRGRRPEHEHSRNLPACQAIGGIAGIGVVHRALFSHVPAKGQQKNDGPLDLMAVVKLSPVVGAHVGHGSGSGDVTRQGSDHRGRNAGNAGDLLRRVILEMGLQPLEHGLDLNGPVGRHNRVSPLHGGHGVAKAQAQTGRFRKLVRPAVPEEINVVPSTAFEVSFPQELPGVHPHQKGKISLLLQEILPVKPFIDDYLGHGQCEGRIGSHIYGNPQIGVDSRGVVVRGDADHPGAVVAGLCQQVVVGDVCIGGVSAPYQDQVGVPPVVHRSPHERLSKNQSSAHVLVARVGLDGVIGNSQGAHQGLKPHGLAAQSPAAAKAHNGIHPFGRKDLDQGVGDLV